MMIWWSAVKSSMQIPITRKIFVKTLLVVKFLLEVLIGAKYFRCPVLFLLSLLLVQFLRPFPAPTPVLPRMQLSMRGAWTVNVALQWAIDGRYWLNTCSFFEWFNALEFINILDVSCHSWQLDRKMRKCKRQNWTLTVVRKDWWFSMPIAYFSFWTTSSCCTSERSRCWIPSQFILDF